MGIMPQWDLLAESADIGFLFLQQLVFSSSVNPWLKKALQVIFQVFAWAKHQAGGVKVPVGMKPSPLEAVRIVHYVGPGRQTQLLLSRAICCGSHTSASTSGHEPWAAGSRHKLLLDMESKRGRRWHPKEDMLQKEGKRERSTGVICSNDCSRDGNKQNLTS